MKLIFAGTPEFARVALEALHAAGHEIALVLTQPDRPAGRGMKLQASSVKQFAIEKNIPVAQPISLRLNGKYPEIAAQTKALIESIQADAMIVAAYGLILPAWTLQTPRLGCFNIHASLLPRWRGAAPIHRAIEAGDSETGITIMQMNEGLDTGDMLLVEKMSIEAQDNTASLHEKLAALGATLMLKTLALAEQGRLQPAPQSKQGACYAAKIDKSESAIDWQQSAAQIERKIRAFYPSPACSAQIEGLGSESVKIFAAELISSPPHIIKNDSGLRNIHQEKTPIGCLISNQKQHLEYLDVQCGQDVLRITELQRAGGKRMSAAEFTRGWSRG